jgi:hypothetical protein
MAQLQHSKIINKVAQQILKPQGLEQKGQSRTWYDDQGLYTIVIEFQPHKWEHGAFLNIGVNFHWYANDYISFDIGYRETKFEKFTTAQQFTSKIESMVQHSLDTIIFYRAQLENLVIAKENILTYNFTSDELWGNYHRGVICGLVGDMNGLNKYFDMLLAEKHNVEWANNLKAKVTELKKISTNNSKFRAEILETVLESRKLKGLKIMQIELLNIKTM